MSLRAEPHDIKWLANQHQGKSPKHVITKLMPSQGGSPCGSVIDMSMEHLLIRGNELLGLDDYEERGKPTCALSNGCLHCLQAGINPADHYLELGLQSILFLLCTIFHKHCTNSRLHSLIIKISRGLNGIILIKAGLQPHLRVHFSIE